MSIKNILFLFLLPLYLFSQDNFIDVNGLKQGYWEIFFPYNNDSIVSEEGVCLNDVEDGLWIKYHDNGQVRELLNYNQGQLDGIRIVISNKGKLLEQEFFILGDYHGRQIYFHDNGKLRSEEFFYFGERHGLFSKYYRNGKKQEAISYLNNEKNGFSRWYFDNEQLSVQYSYNEGLIVDTVFTFYKTGELKSKSIYSLNELNGEKIIFYPSGVVKEKGSERNRVKTL